MAKIPFSKLGIKIDNQVHLITWGEYNIEVQKYLPAVEKADLISKVINASVDTNGFYNPLRIKINLTLEIIYAYTNLSFTEKQKENELKLYDLIVSSGLFNKVISLIPEDEQKELHDTVEQTITNIYNYRNSVLGILDTVKNDYSDLNLDADEIQTKLSDPENLELLRSVLGQLG
jgi:hypothetical protein